MHKFSAPAAYASIVRFAKVLVSLLYGAEIAVEPGERFLHHLLSVRP
jgi:hypothetical protein